MTGLEIGSAVAGSVIVGYLIRKGIVKDVSSIRKFDGMLQKGSKWTHKQKIAELNQDSGLSDQYLKKLIENSRSKFELKEIEYHIRATKTHDYLLRKVQSRIDELQLQEFLKQLIKKGTSMVDDLSHYI